ncbi:hypothetical protein C1645_882789 [Glomus cerebriforme]|uniref:Uncharacterized protein n=1 Tax=Glomus cerebriforme TaxID=658196 RepID=A0A397RYD1_9GLOM|nr:hypothetical protein C1645_882789 [Glomus cerebriforme]
MEIIFLNKYVRKFKRYFIISIFFYLIISNDLVLGKGGGGRGGNKGGGNIGGKTSEDGIGTSKNKATSSTVSSGNRSGSSWVFFYYGGSGQRYCGNLCILTCVLVSIIILLIIGCGICMCYRTKKRSNAEDQIEANDTNSYNGNDNIYPPQSNALSTTSSFVPPPTYYPPPKINYNYTQNYSNNNLDGNYTNYAPGHNKLSPPLIEDNYDYNQVKISSRRESFDSMDEVLKKNKKK